MKTLEHVIEELTPEPDPDFVADMERRMQLGFPPERKPRFALPKVARAAASALPSMALPRLRPAAVAGAAASAMLALLVTVSLVGGGGDQPQPDQPVALDAPTTEPFVGPTGTAAPREGGGGASVDPAGNDAGGAVGAREAGKVAPAGAGARLERRRTAQMAPDAVPLESLETVPSGPLPPVGRRRGIAPDVRNRRVERAAQLSLAADPGDFDRIADDVFAVADRRGGFVLSSSFTQGEDGASGGFFELRVPAAQLPRTLEALSRIATVRARSESGNDVTGAFVSTRDRLRIARAERESLLLRLETATTEQAAAAIRSRLEIVARDISAARNRLDRMRERTDYATVTVDLVDEHAGPKAGRSQTGRALDDAVGSLEDVGAVLIRALGILVPLGLAAALGWTAAVRARRRARERALA
jgi:hypothetical protein